MFNAGVHVPLIPFNEVVGKAAMIVPAQTAGTGVNVGAVAGLTVMVRVVLAAHCPASGVNVYVVVVVLFKAGAHVPVIPFKEVAGKAAMIVPAQTAATGLKVGTIAAPEKVEIVVANGVLVHPFASFITIV